MNYHILKHILDSLLSSFKCPDCSTGIKSYDVNILGINENGLTVEIKCKNCGKTTMVKAETSSVNLGNLGNIPPEALELIKKKLAQNNQMIIDETKEINKNNIKEKEIIDLKNILKKDNLGVQDFFKDI